MPMVNSEWSDAQLLEEYLGRKSEAAFEALLRRHGQMVYNVCFRFLRHEQDAEDATQAVFLTLAHKAASLRNRNSLAGWLYQVSWNVTQRAKEARVTRSHHETPAENISNRPGSHQDWDRLLGTLDKAISELPEKYRLPMVLHHLQGQSQEQTAQILGINANTIATQLLRAREMVRENLERSGVMLSAGALTTQLAECGAGAALPESLVVSTSKAAAFIAAGRPAEQSMVSTHAAGLVQDTMRSMRMKRMRTAVAAAILLLAITGSTGFVFRALAQDEQPVVAAAPVTEPRPAPVVEAPKDPKPEPTPADPLAELVGKLGDPLEDNRDDAESALRKEGMKAMAALEKGEISDNLEIRSRSQKLLAVLKFKPVVEGLRARFKEPEKAASELPSFKTKFRLFSTFDEGLVDIVAAINVAEKFKHFSLQVNGSVMNVPVTANIVMDEKFLWLDTGKEAKREIRRLEAGPLVPAMAALQQLPHEEIASMNVPGNEKKMSTMAGVLDMLKSELDIVGVAEEKLEDTPVYRITAYVQPMDSAQRQRTLQEGGQSKLEQLVGLARNLKLNIWLAQKDLMLRKGELSARNDQVLAMFELTSVESGFPLNLADYTYTPPEGIKVQEIDFMEGAKLLNEFNASLKEPKVKKQEQPAAPAEPPASPPPPPATNF